jgi:hypothetical protein
MPRRRISRNTAGVPTPLPTRLLLPVDARVPLRRLDGRATAGDAPWQTPYQSRFVTLEGERELDAWLHFCLGHHIEFLLWQATALAGERVIAAVRADERDEVVRWMGRVTRLVRGSGALLHYCAAFDPSAYDPCLRASMEAERDDFSGDMSTEFLAMMAVKADLVELLSDVGHLGRELQAFRAAERSWAVDHGEVIHALHPGKSLLREKAERLAREADAFDYRGYVERVVRGAQARSDYDDYFGVSRVDDLTLDAYWTQAVAKVALAHAHLTLRGVHRSQIMRADAALLETLSALVDRSG